MPAPAPPRQDGTEPSDPLTDFLCVLYGDVLGRSSVGPGDDFFADLNGNSLGAAEVIVTVERIFGVAVLEAFFADSSPSAVAHEIEGHLRGGEFDPGRAREAVSSGGAVADGLSRLLDSLEESNPVGPAPGSTA